MAKIVIFEGADRVGKTTSMKSFNRISKYKHLLIDRALISNYVYDSKFKRKSKTRWITLARTLFYSGVPVVFVLVVPGKTILDRMSFNYRRDVSKFVEASKKFHKLTGIKLVILTNDFGKTVLRSRLKRLSEVVDTDFSTEIVEIPEVV